MTRSCPAWAAARRTSPPSQGAAATRLRARMPQPACCRRASRRLPVVAHSEQRRRRRRRVFTRAAQPRRHAAVAASAPRLTPTGDSVAVHPRARRLLRRQRRRHVRIRVDLASAADGRADVSQRSVTWASPTAARTSRRRRPHRPRLPNPGGSTGAVDEFLQSLNLGLS